jgi:hypothetical protein
MSHVLTLVNSVSQNVGSVIQSSTATATLTMDDPIDNECHGFELYDGKCYKYGVLAHKIDAGQGIVGLQGGKGNNGNDINTCHKAVASKWRSTAW